MIRVLGLSLLLASLTALLAQEKPAPKDVPPFTLPPGFIAEKVAGPPLVLHPTMAGFDEAGRLFVAENIGTNSRAAELLKKLPSTVHRLVDSNGDGRFDDHSTFADQLTFPQGALWLGGSLYTCSPPSVWKFDDPKHTGKEQGRTELVTKFDFTGNAADTHGPFLGPDGRLYWCDGRHGHEIVTREGHTLKGKAARIFRCRPDGREVEYVCGGGMDNPVEVVFTDEGEPIACVDLFQSSPARMDVLLHAIEGGVFPHYQPVLGEFKTTGPLLPPAVELGWVAPAGMCRYRGSAFGAAFRGNLFLCQFNTHKVVRVILERSGSTFTGKVEDFLTSTNPDFHATDVLEDADGSLLVIDTGGWFRIGCPTSQIAKPEIPGSIWRVRKADAPRIDDPRGAKLAWDKASLADLARRLEDGRPVVRDRAIQALRERGDDAILTLGQILAKHPNEAVRRDALWTLAGIDTARARSAAAEALHDASVSVRQVAVRVAGLNRYAPARDVLQERVVKGTPPERREAAVALGRIGDKAAVPALIRGLESASDRILEHSLIYALMQLGDIEATRKGLDSQNAAVQKGVLVALDRIDPASLKPADVLPRLESADANLRTAALDLATARPEWAGELVGWVEKAFTGDRVPAPALRSAIARLAATPPMQELIGRLLMNEKLADARSRLLLEEIARLTLAKTPPAWVPGLRRLLGSGAVPLRWSAATAIRARNLDVCDDLLSAIAGSNKIEGELRTLALATLGTRLKPVPAEAFAFLRSRLAESRPPLERLSAAQALGVLALSEAQRQTLCDDLPKLGPLELPPILAAFEPSSDDTTGKRLVASLEKAAGLTAVTPGRLTKTLANFPPAVKSAAGPLFDRILGEAKEQLARLSDLEKTLPTGEGRRGRSVFYGAKAVCSACHTVNGQGGAIGPNLSKIGTIRTERDLLEAILLPSVSIVRGYETFQVSLKDGRQVVGLLTAETPESLTLINAERNEVPLARSAIESLEPTRTSLMPAGLDKQLSHQEIADLLAFLKGLK